MKTYIYEKTFKNKVPPEHLLLRDYARGILEYAIYKGLIDVQIDQISAPYGSKMPLSIPSESELKKYELKVEGRNTQETLYSIIMNGSDFCRYEIGTNSYCDYADISTSSKITYDNFIKGLSKAKLRTLKDFGNVISIYTTGKIKRDFIEDYVKKMPSNLQIVFKIGEHEAQEIFNFMYKRSFSNSHKKGRFDFKIIQKLIVKDVFETYGWNETYFGNYDSQRVHFFSRHHSDDVEGIGMKYIWIAYYKWLSIVFDNFLIKSSDNNPDQFEIYKGAWNPYKRDIDPTILITETHRTSHFEPREFTWWYSEMKFEELRNSDLKKWSLDKSDLIHPINLIELSNQNINWLNLNSYPSWRYDKNDSEHHDVWYHIKSYIIKKEHKGQIIKALSGKSFFNSSIQEERSPYEIYSREYYWSAAYEDTVGGKDWRFLHSSLEKKNIIGAITSIDYTWQEDRDHSKEQNLSVTRPSKIVYDLMDLKFKKEEHNFYSQTDELIVTNPTIEFQSGCNALLIKKEKFLEKLAENNFDIIWLVLGAKEVIVANTIVHEGQINNIFYYNDEGKMVGELTLTPYKD